jgi:hypothetical protein
VNGKQRAKQGKNHPGKQALHYPETLPAPGLHPVDGHITARLAKGTDGND